MADNARRLPLSIWRGSGPIAWARSGLEGLAEGMLLLNRRAMAHPWSRLWLGNVVPAAFFLMVLIVRSEELVAFFGEGAEAVPGTAPFVLLAAQRVLGILFLAVAVTLFMVRRAPIVPLQRIRDGVVALLGTFAMSLVAMVSPMWQDPLVNLVSAGLLVAGIGFTVVALLCLGRCLGIFPEARGLVTRGPYRFVRHPVYLGEMVSGLGMLLPVATPYTVAVYAAFCGIQYWRAVNEERVLCLAFPEYEAYKRRTWRILPGVH